MGCSGDQVGEDNMALSKRAQANIERQTRRLCGGAGRDQSEEEKIPPKKAKSRAEANIERQTALMNGKR
jgi:hypothetical protein